MGLPPDDPLRFDKEGMRLTKVELDAKLDAIIESWPKFVPLMVERSRARLSDDRGAPRRKAWLSR